MTGPCFILISLNSQAHYQQFLEINPARFLGLIRFVKRNQINIFKCRPYHRIRWTKLTFHLISVDLLKLPFRELLTNMNYYQFALEYDSLNYWQGHIEIYIPLYLQLKEWYIHFKFTAMLLAFSNSAFNPLIYAGFNENFRKGRYKPHYFVVRVHA